LADKKETKVKESEQTPQPPRGRFAGYAARIKQAARPVNILKYLLGLLWKPILFFALLFSLFLGASYAASYYKLIDARTALDFEPRMARARETDNTLARYALPVAEWSCSVVAAAGEIIQTRVERQEVIRLKEEQERLAKKQEEDRLAKLEAEKEKAKQEKPAGANDQPAREAERKKQEAELRKLAAERQQELNKRAGKLATYYAAMPTADAVRILRNLGDEEIVVILSGMPDAAVAQILAGFEPERAAAVSKQILRPQPSLPEDKLAAGIL
jgi:flagellar motility protein MotE (MotC chaperone)